MNLYIYTFAVITITATVFFVAGYWFKSVED